MRGLGLPENEERRVSGTESAAQWIRTGPVDHGVSADAALPRRGNLTILTAGRPTHQSTAEAPQYGRGVTSLSLVESRQRAALLRPTSYDVRLDLTDAETFGSHSTIRFTAREPGAETFVEIADACRCEPP